MALNEQQERFCQQYVIHRNATEAAKGAGYSETSAYNQGYRLLQTEAVKERIADLEKETFTSIDVIAELEKTYEEASSSGQAGNAIKALELLSKVRGHKSDDEVHKDKAGLHADVVSALNILGADETLALIKDCDWWDEEDLGEPIEAVSDSIEGDC